MVEPSILTVLAFSAIGLLVAVTGGVAYLTVAEWRDRRRRELEEKQQKLRTKPKARRR